MPDTVNREAMRAAAALMRIERKTAAAALMGSRRTERKAKSSRENGKLGGSPRLFAPCESGKPHRWKKRRCRFCGQTKAALKLKGEQ